MEYDFADETEDLHKLIGFASGGSVLDIAERKTLEDRLTFNDVRMETIVSAFKEMLDHTFAGVIIRDVYTGEFVYQNQAASRLLDKLFDHSANKMFTEVTKIKCQSEHPPTIRTFLKNGEQYEIDYRGVKLYIRAIDGHWYDKTARVVYFTAIS